MASNVELNPTAPREFKREIGLLSSTMIVIGSMIGSGIFIVSADISRTVGSTGLLLLVWLITGFMTLVGALSYGELAGMMPSAGGQYVYLREAYNPLVGFLYGWTLFLVIQTGTIAAVAVAFAKFASVLVPALGESDVLMTIFGLKISAAQALAISIILILTYI
ncbi:MAG TPA: amino acid permease, partial [Bacteroidota bacterium]|nr:amino acid permease [Bacteroidota bacterium]